MVSTYNLFISHPWTYPSAYKSLCTLLDRAGFSYKNYFVPKDDLIHNAPNVAALYAAIKTQITPCHIVLIMAGKYATYSKWIEREIKIAKTEFGTPKPVLGIKPWANTQVSSVVSRHADKIAAWNVGSIIATIRELAL